MSYFELIFFKRVSFWVYSFCNWPSCNLYLKWGLFWRCLDLCCGFGRLSYCAWVAIECPNSDQLNEMSSDRKSDPSVFNKKVHKWWTFFGNASLEIMGLTKYRYKLFLFSDPFNASCFMMRFRAERTSTEVCYGGWKPSRVAPFFYVGWKSAVY